MDSKKKLYRSQSDKMFAGVAGGLGNYLEVDSTIVRVIFILLFFASGGFALLLYIALILIVPLEPTDSDNIKNGGSNEKNEDKEGDKIADRQFFSSNTMRWIIAGILILVGFNMLSHQFFPSFNFKLEAIWPILLIIIGFFLILRMPTSISSSINNEDSDISGNQVSNNKKEDDNTARLVMGVIIVVLGMLFLANTFGWLSFQIGVIWNLWPFLLIFFGLAMISPWRWLTWVVAGIFLLGILWAAITGFSAGQKPADVQRIDIDRAENIESANINMRMGAGKLTVSGGSQKLVTGSLESSFMELDISNEIRDRVQNVDLNGEGSWKWTSFGRGSNRMDVQLNSEIPINLKITTGAIDMDIDLSEVIVESIDLDTGASNLVLNLGDKSVKNDVKIDAGASSIQIGLPRTVGVRIQVDSGLSAANLQDFNEVESNIYESDNFDEAEKTINIEVDMGVSSFNVFWR